MRAGSQEAVKDVVRNLASVLGEESSQSSQQRSDTIGLGYLKNLAAVLRTDWAWGCGIRDWLGSYYSNSSERWWLGPG